MAHRSMLFAASLALGGPFVAARVEADAPKQPADDGAAEDEAAGGVPPGGPAFESVVVARRPASRDATQDDRPVAGEVLRDSPRGSTLEALSQESGDVYVAARGVGVHGVGEGASGGIHVRGLGGSPNDQVVVVEDGVPDVQGIFGHPLPDAYVPFLLEDALVVRGGDSVLYGTNALGGAILLRRRWRAEDGGELENDAAGGSYATLRETAAALVRSGPWDFAAAVNLFDTDGHRAGAGGDDAVGDLAVRLRLGDDLRLTLHDKVIHLAGADPGPASHPNADHTYDVWRDDASLRLDYDAGALSLAVTPYVNVGLHRLYDGFRSLDTTVGMIAEVDVPLGRTAELVAGVAFERVDGDVENRITGETSAVRATTDFSLYHQLTFHPVPELTAVVGARELYSTTYGFVPLLKAGLRWDVADGFYLHARVTRNFRQPTIRELYLPFPTANPDLRPEYALNADFGAGYRAGRFDVSCTGYRTQAQDLIKYFGSWPTAEVVNIGHLTIWGVEAQARVERLGPVSLSLAGGWQDVGIYTKQNPSAKLDFTVEAGHDFGAHFVGGTVGGEWVHGLYMDNYGRQPMDDAFVMDLTVRYRYTSPDRGFTLEPYVFLRNFLDRRYAYVADYPMPGFNVLAGLKVGL